jgi:hypothetical protein
LYHPVAGCNSFCQGSEKLEPSHLFEYLESTGFVNLPEAPKCKNKNMKLISIMHNTPILENKDKNILQKIHQGILDGNSDIKNELSVGLINVLDIAKAIKNERCLCLKHRDFGNTYLEQIIGNIIHDVLPITDINRARIIFGLEPMSEKELRQKVQNKRRGELKSKLKNRTSNR